MERSRSVVIHLYSEEDIDIWGQDYNLPTCTTLCGVSATTICTPEGDTSPICPACLVTAHTTQVTPYRLFECYSKFLLVSCSTVFCVKVLRLDTEECYLFTYCKTNDVGRHLLGTKAT